MLTRLQAPLKKDQKNYGMSKSMKARVVKTLNFSIAIYGCEQWEVKAASKEKTEAFEMWCWLRLLCISWMEKKTNPSVRTIIGEKQTLMSEINRCKLMYFGSIRHRDEHNPEKANMKEMVEG